jgi:thymidylate kinase
MKNNFQDFIKYVKSLDMNRNNFEELYDNLLYVFQITKKKKINENTGFLVSVDGHSGAGKDTAIHSIDCVINEFSDKTSEVIIQKRSDPFRPITKKMWEHPNSYMMLCAGRKYIIDYVIPKKFETNDIIILNRSYLSNVAYHANSINEIPKLIDLCYFDPKPNLQFILECDTKIAFDRIVKRSVTKGGNIYVNEQPEYIDRVKQNFNLLSKNLDVHFIDSNQNEEKVFCQMIKYFEVFK